ncbi:MAG: GNAT family N-acetyltransferase [Bacteroidota bacterium]
MLEIKFGKFPVLETERLFFRQINANDVQDVFELRTNERVIKYSDRPKMKNIQEAVEMIKKISTSYGNNEGIAWAMEMKETKKTAGHITYWRIIKEHHRAEIGYALLPDYWGKGIMTEAINKIIEFGFSEMKLHSIEANVNPANLPSIKLLERTGFKREAYFKENYFFEGRFLDSAIYSLINNKES